MEKWFEVRTYIYFWVVVSGMVDCFLKEIDWEIEEEEVGKQVYRYVLRIGYKVNRFYIRFYFSISQRLFIVEEVLISQMERKVYLVEVGQLLYLVILVFVEQVYEFRSFYDRDGGCLWVQQYGIVKVVLVIVFVECLIC